MRRRAGSGRLVWVLAAALGCAGGKVAPGDGGNGGGGGNAGSGGGMGSSGAGGAAGSAGSGGSDASTSDARDAPADLGPERADGPAEAPFEAPFEAPAVPQDNGAACAAPGDCKSGLCVDGVCCATACTGTCKSCALGGMRGTCGNAAAGSDPRGDCPDDGAASCGRDGACDGAGACRKYPPGAVCAPAACSGSTRTTAGTCSAGGTCTPGTMSSCAPYACGPTDCLVSCTTAGDCVAPATCMGSSCGPKSMGASCSSGAECASGFCADSTCCDTACTAPCHACNLAGGSGVCTLVSAGGDPRGDCPDDGAASCGRDGACDGTGACRKYPAGTVCTPASCSVSTKTTAATCDAAGTCTPGTMSSCAPYVCGSGDCLVSCTTAGDCVAPATCMGSTCM